MSLAKLGCDSSPCPWEVAQEDVHPAQQPAHAWVCGLCVRARLPGPQG